MRSIDNLIEDLSQRAQRCADTERASVPTTFTFVPIYYRDVERLIDAHKKMRAALETHVSPAQVETLLAELDGKE